MRVSFAMDRRTTLGIIALFLVLALFPGCISQKDADKFNKSIAEAFSVPLNALVAKLSGGDDLAYATVSFQQKNNRWPNDYAELTNYVAKSDGYLFLKPYDSVTFSSQTNGGVKIAFIPLGRTNESTFALNPQTETNSTTRELQQNRRQQMAETFAAFIAANDAKYPILPDKDLIARFKNNQPTLNKLVAMIHEDPKLYRVDEDWTFPHNIKDADLSGQRLQQYRQLLHSINCDRGFAAYPTRPGIYFISGSTGLAVSGRTKGFYYNEHPPTNVVQKIDTYRPTSTRAGEVFRHIDGPWYIYMDW